MVTSNSRAKFLLWTLAGLFLGAVGSASAQSAFNCGATAGVPPIVRAEGLTEAVGDLILNCTGGNPTAAGAPVPRVNFQILLNTNVTSRVLSDLWSEALLLIDEPAGTPSTAGNLRYCTTIGGCLMTGVGTAGGVNYQSGDSRNPSPANVFQGRQVGANQIAWLGIPVDPPGANASRIIRITNVRANANQLGVSSTLIPKQIDMFVSATSTTSIPINNPQQTVAFIQLGMTFSTRTLTSANYLQCVSSNAGAATDSMTALTNTRHILRYSEMFASAFKRRSAAYTTADESPTPPAQNTPNNQHFTESGFYNPYVTSAANNSGGLTANVGEAGLASQGTRLLAQFTNVPTGVVLYASVYGVTSTATPALSATATAVNSTIRLVATTVSGSGGLPGAEGIGGSAFAPVAATTVSSESGLSIPSAPITLSGGTGIAVWEVMTSNPFVLEEFEVAVSVAYVANASRNLPTLGTASVAGGFAPLSTAAKAAVTNQQSRFADYNTQQPLFSVNACSTNIMFPFLTNRLGMDSGIAIANTSADPSRAVTQAGSCKLNYYGDTTGGGAAPAAQTTAEIPSGKILTATLSGGGNYGVAATPGFQGYVIAQCSFQYGHGLAYLSDVGANRIAKAYLGLVMDAAQERRSLPTISVVPPRLGNTSPALRAGTPRNWRDGIVQRWVPSGVFEYGCSPGDSECQDNEKPTHLYRSGGFWMQETEVTQAAFKRVLWGYGPFYFKGETLPAENVHYEEAALYCREVGLRLPDEVDWEYAARGGTTGVRYGPLNEIAWWAQNSWQGSGFSTRAVKGKSPNAFGLYDMLGNVAEWTASTWWTGPQANLISNNPYVIRGGSFYDSPQTLRVSYRNNGQRYQRTRYTGFRCIGD